MNQIIIKNAIQCKGIKTGINPRGITAIVMINIIAVKIPILINSLPPIKYFFV